MNYPNNDCGECPVWLAIGEDITKEEAINKYCNYCPLTARPTEENDGTGL